MVWLKLPQVRSANAVSVLTKLTSYTSTFTGWLNTQTIIMWLISYCTVFACGAGWSHWCVFGGADSAREQIQGTQLCIWNPTLTLWLSQVTRSVEKMNLRLRRFPNSSWHIGYCNDYIFFKTLIDLLNKGKAFYKLITLLFTPQISSRTRPHTSIMIVEANY